MKIKKILKSFYTYITDSDYRFLINEGFGIYKNLGDVEFTKRKFRIRMGYELNLSNPQTFNEKLQWLKLFDHNPAYTKMVDKYEAKKYVEGMIGSQYIIPTLGIWNRPEDINWNSLPNQFVLKVTHDSGGIIICRDKSKLDKKEAIKELKRSLKTDYYSIHREWPYKDVTRRIIAEKYMQDNKSIDLKDYKFYCFNGVPRFLYVSEGLANHKTAKVIFITTDWIRAPFARDDFQSFSEVPPKPKQFDKMMRLARVLAEKHPFLRVDFYEINGNVFFGELTFCPCAGMMHFNPPEYDQIIGDMLILPKEKIKGGKRE